MTEAEKHATFLRCAWAALVLRGHNSPNTIADPILRDVWRFGRKIAYLKKPAKKKQ